MLRKPKSEKAHHLKYLDDSVANGLIQRGTSIKSCITKMPRLLELFKGTGSVGDAFEKLGWQVTSVDMVAKFKPTHLCNILDFEYQQYAPEYFDFVWASPPCTEFSIAKTQGIRDIEGATKVVEKTLEIIRYFNCSFAMENPQSGYLKQQPCVQ